MEGGEGCVVWGGDTRTRVHSLFQLIFFHSSKPRPHLLQVSEEPAAQHIIEHPIIDEVAPGSWHIADADQVLSAQTHPQSKPHPQSKLHPLVSGRDLLLSRGSLSVVDKDFAGVMATDQHINLTIS